MTIGTIAVSFVDEHLGLGRDPLTRVPEGEESGTESHRHEIRDHDHHSDKHAVRLTAAGGVAI